MLVESMVDRQTPTNRRSDTFSTVAGEPFCTLVLALGLSVIELRTCLRTVHGNLPVRKGVSDKKTQRCRNPFKAMWLLTPFIVFWSTPQAALARRLFRLAQQEYHSRYECLSHREIR